MYFKYLSAAFGSAMITSVYSASTTGRRERRHWRSSLRSGTSSTVLAFWWASAAAWFSVQSAAARNATGVRTSISHRPWSAQWSYPFWHGSGPYASSAPSWPSSERMAPTIVRTYALSFLLLPFNIFSTYYFQAIMKPKAAFVVSVARGLVISGILIMVLPALVNADAIWFAMPVTELLVMLYAASMIRKYTRALPGGTTYADTRHWKQCTLADLKLLP